MISAAALTNERRGVKSSAHAMGSVEISVVAHVIIALCMFSCACVKSAAPPDLTQNPVCPKCLFRMVPAWYAAHVANGKSTVGIGRPGRKMSA